jgi:predicted metal-dependent hydrolase
MGEAMSRAQLMLPDGRALDFAIRASAKARWLRLKMSARHGLVVTVPRGIERARVMELVTSKTGWIVDRLTDFDAVRQVIGTDAPARPQAFSLAGLGESWRVEYKDTSSTTVAAQTDQPGRIVVSGAIDNTAACHAALRRWLFRHAKATMPAWLADVAQQTKLQFTDLAIKNQRTRWGSCTVGGRISLNCKLLFLPRELVRYVMVHELCHRLEANHSSRFWAHVRRYEPSVDALNEQMRDAWKNVPAWAQPGSGAWL